MKRADELLYELAEAQHQYITFLELKCGDLAVFAHVHGQNASKEDIAKGELCRKKISRIKKKAGIPEDLTA